MARMSLPKLVAEYDRLKQERDALDAQMKTVQAGMLAALDAKGEKTIPVEVDGRTVKVTRVQAISMIIDESSLKRLLGEKGWMKVSTRVLDRKKLEASIAANETDPILVAEASSEKVGAPYVKVT